MRFLASLLSVSLVVATPGTAAALQLAGRGPLGKIPTLSGPYKPQIQNGPLKLDALKVSGSLENTLHVIDPVLQRKVPVITPSVIDAARPLDERQPVELGIARSSLLFDNAKPFSDRTAVYAARTGFRSFGLAKNVHLSGPAKAGPASWADQARELNRLKTEAKAHVRTKVRLAVGTFMTAGTGKLLVLFLGYWGLGITGAAALFIAGKLLQTLRREKAGRRRAWVLAQALKGGAPSSLQVVELIDDVKPALVKILARGVAPEHEKNASELRRFLAEVETGERKNWSLTAAATNLLGTAEPLIDAYRHSIWNETGAWKMGFPELEDRERELARLVERLTGAAEVGDRMTRDLRFLADRVPLGNENRNVMAMLWKLGVLQRESRRDGDAAFAAAVDAVADRLIAHFDAHFQIKPTAATAEALLKAIDAAIRARH